MIKNSFYGWTLLAVMWLIMAFNLGFPAYSPSVINPEMGKSLGFTRDVIGLMMSLYIILSGLPGPLVAMLVNKAGVRATIVIGSAMIVTGASAMATMVHTSTGAYLAFGVLVGGGVCTGAALPCQTGLARWFLRRRATALSIMYSAGAIGGAVAAKLLENLIIRTGDWRNAWWVIAGLSGLAAVLALIFVRERPEDMGQAVDGVVADDVNVANAAPAKPKPAFITTVPWEFRDAVRNPTYWLILGSLLGGSGVYTLFLAHGKLLLEDFGHAVGIGGTAVFTMTISGLVAKVIIVLFGDRFDPRYLWAIFMAVFGVGAVVMVHASTLPLVYLFAFCLGIGFGGGVVCLMTVLGNYFGLKAFALLCGIAIAVNTTLSALAPWAAGRLFERGFGYQGICYFLAAWCFVGAVVLFFIRKPMPPNSRPLTA
jgi:sugar phosphate permease